MAGTCGILWSLSQACHRSHHVGRTHAGAPRLFQLPGSSLSCLSTSLRTQVHLCSPERWLSTRLLHRGGASHAAAGVPRVQDADGRPASPAPERQLSSRSLTSDSQQTFEIDSTHRYTEQRGAWARRNEITVQSTKRERARAGIQTPEPSPHEAGPHRLPLPPAASAGAGCAAWLTEDIPGRG